jgi:serine O-acetyltransferase
MYSENKSLRRNVITIFTSVGFTSVVIYRVQSICYKYKLLIFAYALHRLNLSIFGIDILPGSTIGEGLRIEHPVGIVIGSGSKLGSNCIVMQGVTIGLKHPVSSEYDGYPTIGSNVLLGAHSSILGPITIGDMSIIGAHSLAISNIPERAIAVGTPARIIEFRSNL